MIPAIFKLLKIPVISTAGNSSINGMVFLNELYFQQASLSFQLFPL